MANGLPIFDPLSGGGIDPMGAVPATLPLLPSGAGTTTTTPTTSTGGLALPWWAIALAGLGDELSRAQGKPSNQLGAVLQFQAAGLAAQREERAGRTEARAVETEARRAKTEEQRLGLERGRFALDMATKQGDFIDKAITKGTSGDMDAMTPQTRAVVIQAYRERAQSLGLDATMIPELLTNRDVAKMVSDVAPYLQAQGPDFWNTASAIRASQGPKVFDDFVRQRAQPSIDIAAQNTFRLIANNLEDQKGKGKVTYDDIQIAMSATKPLEWTSVMKNPEVYEGFFVARGIKTPRLVAEAAKVTETTTATEAAKLALEIVEAHARAKARETELVEQVKKTLDIGKPFTAGEAGGVRQQFLTQAKDFSDTLRAFQRVEDAVKDPSAAGDIAVLFGYMKMLDPGSVVRESEFATAQNAAGVPEQIRNTWNRLMTGQRLGEAGAPTREDIANRSRRLVKGQLELHEQTEKVFRTIAKKRGGDAEEIAPDIVGEDLRKRIKEGKGAATAAKPETLSRKDARYPKLKARGLSDEEIQRRFNLRLTP